jgi:phospholipase C
MPLDHTSILKTVERRWKLPPLTARDAAAPDAAAVLTLTQPRKDDPLQGVVVPKSAVSLPSNVHISHLEEVHAELVSQLPIPDAAGGTHHEMPVLRTSADARAYIDARTAAWEATRKPG